MSDFHGLICTFAATLMILLVFKCSTKVSKNLIWQNSGASFVAQELIRNVKLKCC